MLTLIVPLGALYDWASEHRAAIMAARAKFAANRQATAGQAGFSIPK
jgi:hypothetical protein